MACILFTQTACHIDSGLHVPSFDGAQTVYEKGQSIHSLTTGPSIGKYYNYSPAKNLAVFADVRANWWFPQASIAIGGYSPKYVTKAAINKNKVLEKYQYGFHFDSYIGFGYVKGFELLPEYEGTSPFSSIRTNSELTFESLRTYGQLGAHFKGRSIKFDAVYRLNYYDIQELTFKPQSDQYLPYVKDIAKNNPYLLNELQFLLSLGNSDLKIVFGINLTLQGKDSDILDFTKFNSGQIGCTYIFDNFDRY